MKTRIQHWVGAILLGLPLWIVLGGLAAAGELVPAFLMVVYAILVTVALWMGCVLITRE